MKLVTFGEVLLRLSTPNNLKFAQTTQFDVNFGGTEMNVGAVSARWGNAVQHVTAFPDHAMGHKAARFMENLGVKSDYVKFTGNRVGTFFLETGAAMRASQIVYDRAESSFCTTAEYDWNAILEGVEWLHWCGISPAVAEAPAKALLEALKVAEKRGIYVSSDIYYRSNLWNYGKTPQQILPELGALTDCIFGSEENFIEIFGVPDQGSFEATCVATMKALPRITKIVKTERKQLSASRNLFKAKSFDGHQTTQSIEIDIDPIIDRIGTGDAFIGGYIHGVKKYHNDQQALDFAVAACALKHTIHGDQLIATEAEIENLMTGDTSGRLKR